MQDAPIPPYEAQRLKELYSYEVLDTATEAALDAIVQSAAQACGTTFGALTMVDKNRQWFKAQCGFSLKETLRSQSICGHGILTRAFFEVPDTQADVRFRDNPLLEMLGVRFYGGTQLIGADGQVLGMLCVLDGEPQQLTGAQKAQLTTLAIQAMELLETHRQRRRMEWLGALVSQVQDEIYLFDLNKQSLLHANAAATQNGMADLADLRLEDTTPEMPPTELATLLGRLHRNEADITYETWVVRAKGRIPVEARWQRLSTSGPTLVMCTLRDISQRRQLDKAKDAFVAMVSHELRTPLSGLYGAIELLNSGACGELAPQAGKMVALASHNVDRMLHLVDDILDLEQNTAGLLRFDIQAVALQPVLDELVFANAGATALARIHLKNEASTDVAVMADPQRLRQVLGNLVSNALKFAPVSSTVALDASLQRNGSVCITVTDQGPGIPPEFEEQMYQRFTQAGEGPYRTSGGSGLGLSIVKSMTEGMGGTVSHQSQPGRTQFRIELPHASHP